MAPSGRRRKARTRRTHYKQRLVQSENQETSMDLPSNSSSTTSDDLSKLDTADVSTSGCSTPKAQRFRIPEILTCPPAPKKRRVVSNCALQRSPIAFFAPPDLELFFFFALRDISV
ncbi:hypothetical protein L1049_018118 [Liquidambar formosana]|uniref:Uncharacterized protein n=1 Tax=Liquidambar formosana TaxID=63359 RepID=A0AAP0NKA0_LIQFO